ncbi:MAG: SAM-dependent methyltransferase [Rhodobacteraceae bacterium]|nr:SAM-dependent methyltransferase [Paracoccaceae bacterium]
MATPPKLTDRAALDLHRQRALQRGGDAFFLVDHAKNILLERLEEVNRSFTSPAIVAGIPSLWQGMLPDAKVVADNDTLDLASLSHDLILHGLALHWADDPVGQLIQCNRALEADGLFVAVAFGGETLADFRTCLRDAEVALTGGLSPRMAPMADLRDLGALMQRAGFALPVADSLTVPVSYASAFALMRDLRGMGETNALDARDRKCPPKALFAATDALYRDRHGDSDGRITARFELVFLTGWAPSADQPKPLRPGSATTRLADALGVEERPTGDKTPRRHD